MYFHTTGDTALHVDLGNISVVICGINFQDTFNVYIYKLDLETFVFSV